VNRRLLTLGITLGDAGGIGPEIALKAAARAGWPAGLRLVLIGSREVLRAEAGRLKLPVPLLVDALSEVAALPAGQAVAWDPAPQLCPSVCSGRTSVAAARAAAAWVEAAARACLRGELRGMVTAPLSKEGLHRAGIAAPGHTEMLAGIAGVSRYAMMLLGGGLRVVLATRHLPLARVARALSSAAIETAASLTAEALPWLGLPGRVVGIAALNPHAGDGGALGREEIDVIRPAIRRLRGRGLNVEGPVPADVLFYQARHGRYGAVVAMYHDQGLGPLKMVGFETGVNLTLGLPFVRTSPDHGTAFDIAGRGVADTRSLVAAIRLAARLARRPNPWAGRP
jgi:4-hydroxythreonine-4-phosphate dehydrogenase